jgi:hypothetical protein
MADQSGDQVTKSQRTLGPVRRAWGSAKRLFRPFAHVALLVPIGVMCIPLLPGVSLRAPAAASPLQSTAPCFASPGATAGREVFAKRLERHRATHGSLTNLAYLSLLCIGVTLAVISRREKKGLEIQGLHVPILVAFAAICVVMTYLWVQYIFTLNQLLAERRELWDTLKWLEGETNQRAHPSLFPLVQGSPLLDAWMQTFPPKLFVESPSWSSSVLSRVVNRIFTGTVLLGVAAAVGLAHGSVFAILDEIPKHRQLADSGKRNLLLAQIALCLVIFLTYLWFELQNSDWWFASAAAWFAYAAVKLRKYLPGPDSADGKAPAAGDSKHALAAQPAEPAEGSQLS